MPPEGTTLSQQLGRRFIQLVTSPEAMSHMATRRFAPRYMSAAAVAATTFAAAVNTEEGVGEVRQAALKRGQGHGLHNRLLHREIAAAAGLACLFIKSRILNGG